LIIIIAVIGGNGEELCKK